jgi:hypothetical protein
MTLLASPANAQSPPEDAAVAEARALYTTGTELSQGARWAEALAAFEHSFKIRPHPATLYNVAQCFRAMGQYAHARTRFAEALGWAKTHRDSGELPESLVVAGNGYVSEIERILVHVAVTISPADAAITVDGAPLVTDRSLGSAGAVVLVAGIAPPGAGAPGPASRFEVVVDPGTRIFAVSRKGFQDVVVRETFAPGTRAPLSLELDRLPAVLNISANREGAIAAVNGVDVGPAPLALKRPAGSYRVVVQKDGFVTYDTQVTVQAGEQVDLRAALGPQSTPITKRWWFWTVTGVVVVGVAATTYALTRPEPDRQPLNGGGLGWTVPVK